MLALEAVGASERNGLAVSVMKVGKLASEMADDAYRLNVVRQDPAVVKAAKQALTDTRQASKSIVELGMEINSAWKRAGRSPQD
jgi:hypothetical protein